ncbi:MAG: response regulator [Anaerolineales bacterium]
MNAPLALIIEDDPQLNQIFTITLGELFAVESISHGAAALQRLGEVTPRLVVLDINLPGASGGEILRAIRANARLVETRVIIVTANPRQAEELQADADVVLIKPVSVGQLRDLARRMT